MSTNTQQPSTLKTIYNQNDAKGGCFLNFKEENQILYSVYKQNQSVKCFL